MRPHFRDRHEAGVRLAEHLEHYRGADGLLVLALPRGGVPVAYEVARRLGAPLDVFLVRKLGVPTYEELAMGAIASGGVQVLNQAVIDRLRVDEQSVASVAAREQRELERREHEFRGDRPPLNVAGRTVILVDDGLATGATMKAAVLALRRLNPHHLAVAVPVAAPETCAVLAAEVDEIVCARTPEPFHSVGIWYDDFSQTTDDEVKALISAAGG